jgi:hypothetical protein
MNRTQVLVGVLVVVALVAFGNFYLNRIPAAQPETASNITTTSVPGQPSQEAIALSQYMPQNLESLSPVKPAKDAQLRMTQMLFNQGKGTVEYTDGNKTYTANFDYSIDEAGKVTVSAFTLKK